MSDIGEATWVTYVGGERVELPASIDGIRAALPETERADFEREVGSAAAQDLPRVLGHWALRTHPEAVREMEETFAALEAGDYSGVVYPYEEREEGAA
ncbi:MULTISPECIES: hypothetical protein [Streptomyces]|uniref:Uncharacterized protein n=1 Tax=Streptomyces harbinensis TaxID=1176198 RepID=A0A1I6WBD4_9ACTN|nr:MULTISPECIES: hypothetical protein [Streptomyces]SFT23298.1 hypothetical protein SAMN05444716_11716 [Streptomyces harbinensis]